MGHWSNREIEIGELGYEDPDGAICLAHIADDYLRSQVGDASEIECTFCGREEEPGSLPFAVHLEKLMPCFMSAFWSYYVRHDEAPRMDGEAFGTEDTLTAVGDLAGGAFDDAVVDVVSQSISDAIVDVEVSTWFTTMDTDDLSLGWRRFDETTRHVSRFVVPGDRLSRSPLARVSGSLDQLLVYVEGEHSLVRTMDVRS